MSAVGVLHADDTVVRTQVATVVSSGTVREIGTHGIHLFAVINEGKVFVPYIIKCAGVHSFEGYLEVVLRGVFPSQVGTESLWELEVAGHEVDVGLRSRTLRTGSSLHWVLATKLREGWNIARIDGGSLHLDTCVSPSILNPNKWSTSVEDADTTTKE